MNTENKHKNSVSNLDSLKVRIRCTDNYLPSKIRKRDPSQRDPSATQRVQGQPRAAVH